MTHSQTTIIALAFFCMWILTLYSRIFDKTIKKHVLTIGVLLVFWMIIKLSKDLFDSNNILWYLFYMPLIFIPTHYYLISKYLIKKYSNKDKYIPLGISVCLFILVLTNNIHKIVFTTPNENGDYYHRIGYYIIVLWILYQLIMATIYYTKAKFKKRRDYKTFLPFLPIVIGTIYTALYVANILSIRHLNMTFILGMLFCLGIECVVQMGLIPNNVRYKKPYSQSNLHMAIIDEDANTILKTNYEMKIPNQIIQDMQENKVKVKYFNLEGKNKEFELKRIKGGYTIFEKDFQEIEELKNSIKRKNNELREQQKLLEKDKDIKQELYEIKIRNEILEELEVNIEEKREIIKEKLKKLSNVDYKELGRIQMLLEYCKRISSLIISNYNNEIYNQEKIKLFITELLKNAEIQGIKGVAVVDDIEPVYSLIASKIYDCIFTVIEELFDIDVLIIITQEGKIINLKIILDSSINGLKQKLEEKDIEKILKIEERQTEEGIGLNIEIEDKVRK